MANKDFKGESETLGAVLVLRYKRIELGNSFDIFHRKLINYAIKEINKSEDVMMIIQYLKDPKSLFDFKNKPKDLTIE